jgi:myosin-5
MFSNSSQRQQPQDDQKLLLKYITQHLGFSGSKPVAALLIYQYLLQSRSFEVAKTGVFDSILQAINSATEVCSTLLICFSFLNFILPWTRGT